jgi:hypothetical protein
MPYALSAVKIGPSGVYVTLASTLRSSLSYLTAVKFTRTANESSGRYFFQVSSEVLSLLHSFENAEVFSAAFPNSSESVSSGEQRK